MQVRKASLLLIICCLLLSITTLTCSAIAKRTPFSSQGFEASNIYYLSQKYTKSSSQLQWVMLIHKIITIVLEIVMTLLLLSKIKQQKAVSMVGIYLILCQMIMSQSAVAGYSVAILKQIGYSGGILYVDIAIAGLSSLNLLLLVIVLVINLYKYVPQPKQCIEKAPIISDSSSFQPHTKENAKEIKVHHIQQQQIQAFHKNRPIIISSSTPMSAFFEGIDQQPEKVISVELPQPETNRKSHQNINNIIQNDFTIQPFSVKKAGREIKIPRLDLNKVKNANIIPQIFFPSFGGIDISIIRPQQSYENPNNEQHSSQSNSEGLEIQQAIGIRNTLSQPFL